MLRSSPTRIALVASIVVLLAATVSATAADRVAQSASLGVLRKDHNVEASDGRKALRLTVPADLVGHAGHTAWMAVTFTDVAGNPLAANDIGYGDAAGNLKVVSLDVAVASDREGLDFVFLIPYVAFPRGPSGRYQVIAHAKLVQRATPRNYAIAMGATVFWVEG